IVICRQVSWVRRQDNGEKVNLLTVEHQTYIGDPRYTVKFQYPDNWRLQIEPVNSSDEGQYECQVSTHPPKYIHVNLHINGESFKSDNEKVGNKGDEGERGAKRGRALGYSAARSRKLATVPPATFVAYGDTNLALKIRPAFWREGNIEDTDWKMKWGWKWEKGREKISFDANTRNRDHVRNRPRIPQIRVSNTRLAQAASGCAPSVDVLPIFDVKQQSVRNPARMGVRTSLSRFSYNNKRLGVVQWLHGNRVLNYDTTRGGISVKTDLMEEGANSTLSIARVGPADSGNYTCHLTTMPDQPATVHVHVLNGEH
ncbi:hypothetical protein WN51_08095, partial [Melipona quadrifasciata]